MSETESNTTIQYTVDRDLHFYIKNQVYFLNTDVVQVRGNTSFIYV